MAIINRDNRFNNLIKTIKICNLNQEDKKNLINYINEIKSGQRNNDFLEDEFLERVFLEIINNDGKQGEYSFLDIVDNVKFIFPYGVNTENYDLLKNMFITSLHNPKWIFNSKLFSIFDNKRDYIDIINIIISNEDYESYFNEIINYGINVSAYCPNQMILKQEIIVFINNLNKCSNIQELMEESLENAKKRVGIYPVDEKTLALISSEARKAERLITKLDNLQKRVNNYQKEVDNTTKNGLEELQNFINSQKDELIKKLDDYLLEIEKDLKASSDKVFNQVLFDTRNKINEIKLMASSLSSRTTDELLRIQKTSEESLSKLKDYVENNGQLKELIKEASDEAKLKEILSLYKLGGNVGGNEIESTEPKGIYIGGNDRLVVPMNQKVVIPNITSI